jgi:hypothetical protein
LGNLAAILACFFLMTPDGRYTGKRFDLLELQHEIEGCNLLHGVPGKLMMMTMMMRAAMNDSSGGCGDV